MKDFTFNIEVHVQLFTTSPTTHQSPSNPIREMKTCFRWYFINFSLYVLNSTVYRKETLDPTPSTPFLLYQTSFINLLDGLLVVVCVMRRRYTCVVRVHPFFGHDRSTSLVKDSTVTLVDLTGVRTTTQLGFTGNTTVSSNQIQIGWLLLW